MRRVEASNEQRFELGRKVNAADRCLREIPPGVDSVLARLSSFMLCLTTTRPLDGLSGDGEVGMERLGNSGISFRELGHPLGPPIKIITLGQ